jgi:uncharacterized repeat protein (TIGR02543 family)
LGELHQATGLLARRVIRHGLASDKPAIVAFSDVSGVKFAIAVVDHSDLSLKNWLIADEMTLSRLSNALVIPGTDSVLFGAVSGGLPVVARWNGQSDVLTGYPSTQPPADLWADLFPGIANSSAIPFPEIESIFVDPMGSNRLKCLVRDPLSMMLLSFLVSQSGEIEAEFELGVELKPSLAAVPGDGGVTLYWDAFPGADSYNLYWTKEDGALPATTTAAVVSGAARPYVHAGLDNGDKYHYLVAWVKNGREEGVTRTANAVPKAGLPIVGTSEFTVSFDSRGGNAFEDQVVQPGGVIVKPSPDPVREGFVFVGWSLNLEGTSIWSFSGSVNEDLTLYAVWQSPDDLTEFAGGLGSSESPWQISTPGHLNSLRNYLGEGNSDKHYVLTNDIDLGVSPWNTGTGWTPIGDQEISFRGKLNGDGFVIRNLFINLPGTDYAGLFGNLGSGAEIGDLGFAGLDVTGQNWVGGLAGLAGTLTRVINSHSAGKVTGSRRVGGLIGRGEGLVTGCYNDARIFGNTVAGGVVGGNVEGTLKDCYNTGVVSGVEGVSTPDSIGGLTGYNNGTIENCYNTGQVNGVNRIGGLVGVNANDLGSFGTVLSSHNAGEVVGTEMVGGVVGVNAENTTVEDCENRGKVTGSLRTGGVLGLNYGSARRVSNTALISGTTFSGGLLGQNNGEISNSFNSGNVTSGEGTGGIVGGNAGVIESVQNTGSITGENSTGGVLGLNTSGSIVKSSFNNGAVLGKQQVGGFVGRNMGKISACFNTGMVEGTGDYYHGGFAGTNQGGEIFDCYSKGSAKGNIGVGGFLGANYKSDTSAATVARCYSTGSVSGPDEYTRGFLAWNQAGSTSDKCFFDKETSGQEEDGAGATPTTTAEMKLESTFADWDFVMVWRISAEKNEGYPYLAVFEESADDDR